MRLKAILSRRCPRCLRRKVFRGLFAMHDRCPECHLKFEREQGYFVGAMYISYILALLLVLPVYGILYLLNASSFASIVVIGVLLVLCSPFLFQYSRILWLHLDQTIDPPT